METQSYTTPFALGQTVITANALAQLQTEDVHQALARHARGDWDDLDPEEERWAVGLARLKWLESDRNFWLIYGILMSLIALALAMK